MAHVRLDDRVREAETAARQNGGLLPRTKALKQSNPLLIQAIYRHPAAFQHIPREFERNARGSVDKSVTLARKIAERNGGKLPRRVDLAREYPGLVCALYKHPEAFAAIPRAAYTERKAGHLADYVRQAEELAAANGGQLLISQKLQTEHNALVCAIRQNPQAFKHIPRIRRETSTIAEHVQAAETLVAGDKDGLLPSASVMKVKHPSLHLAMRRHPEYFQHLKRRSLVTRVNQHRARADELAAANHGVLPSTSWLARNGLRNLEGALYRRPAMFAGIQQEICDSKGRVIGVRTYEAAPLAQKSTP